MSANVNYQVFYDNQILPLSKVMSINFSRNIHPGEDEGQIVIGDFVSIEAAREIKIYRISPYNGSQVLVFRGMTTNVTYKVSANEGKTTTVNMRGLWYMLETRLMQYLSHTSAYIFSTNPFVGVLNPALSFNFGQLFKFILKLSLTGVYSTGYLPPIVPAPTDFDNVVVNDIMMYKYVTVAEMINRLYTSALFGTTSGQSTIPFSAELFLDISANPPTLSVKRYDPLNGIFGIGSDKSNVVVFTEGETLSKVEFQYDYEQMANSFIVSGGSFDGYEIVAIPFDNPSSIAKYGLKQKQLSLGNVVDPVEIKRYVKNVVPLFQQPLPSVSAQVVHYYLNPSNSIFDSVVVGDVVSVTTPSLVGIIKDFNGNPINQPTWKGRIRRIEVSWDVNSGEQITLSFMTPLEQSSQFLYSVISPSIETTWMRLRSLMNYSTYPVDYPLIEKTVLSTSVVLPANDNGFTSDPINVPIVPTTFSDDTNQNTQDIQLHAIYITISADKNYWSNVAVKLLEPDGMEVFSDTVPLNTRVNLTQSVLKYYDDKKNVINTQFGNWTILLLDFHGSDVGSLETRTTYTVTVDVAFTRNPATILNYVSSNPSTTTPLVASQVRLSPTYTISALGGSQ